MIKACIFSTEEGIKEFGKKLLDDRRLLLMGMRYEKNDYPKVIWYFLCNWCGIQ